MRTTSAFFGLLLAFPTVAHAQTPVNAGFRCLSEDGQVKAFNIDLKKRRYTEGDGMKKIESASETTITLRSFFGQSEYGFLTSSLKLNRKTLVLTEFVSASGLNKSKTTIYQCYLRPPIDFTEGTKF